jgi:hypothetical protein
MSKPRAIVVDGESWPVHVLQVVETNDDGSPKFLRVIKSSESVRIVGGESFFTVYGPPALSKPRD